MEDGKREAVDSEKVCQEACEAKVALVSSVGGTTHDMLKAMFYYGRAFGIKEGAAIFAKHLGRKDDGPETPVQGS